MKEKEKDSIMVGRSTVVENGTMIQSSYSSLVLVTTVDVS